MKKETKVVFKDIRPWGRLVKVSSVENPRAFRSFLIGQTMPLVHEEENPMDWAYYTDYLHFVAGDNTLYN